MKTTILQENLIKNLQNVSRYIATKTQIPILSGILIDASSGGISFYATDLKIGIHEKSGGKIEQEGKCVVIGKVFTEFVHTLQPGAVQLEYDGTSLIVTQGRTTASLQTFSVEDYPPFPTSGDEDVVELPLSSTLKAIENVAFASSLDETRPVLASILLSFFQGKGEFVATDGYRLAVQSLAVPAVEAELSVLIPSKTMTEIIRTLSRSNGEKLRFCVTPKLAQASFIAGDTTIVVRITDGEFPPYQSIIPKAFRCQAVIDREEYIQSLRSALVFAKESSSIVEMTISKGTLAIVGIASGSGKNVNEIPASYQGEEQFTISCNAKFLLDALLKRTESHVLFSMNESLQPARLSIPDTEDFVYILSPFKR